MWTEGWHAVLDRELGPEPDADHEKRLNSPRSDFRMHFDTWRLSEQGLRDCFALLPGGDELVERVLDEQVWTPNQIISEARAREMLAKAIADLSHYVDLGLDAHTPVRTLRGTPAERKALRAAPAYESHIPSEEVWERTELTKEVAQVYYFLSETLYQRTSYYLGNYFVIWPFLNAPEGIDPFGNLLQLALSEITWLRDDDGLIIFYNDDEAINDHYQVELDIDGSGVQDITEQIEAGLADVIEHHRARGFPERRFDSFTIGLGGPARRHVKPGEIAAPHGLVDLPARQRVEHGKIALGEGHGLMLDVDELGDTEPVLDVLVTMQVQR